MPGIRTDEHDAIDKLLVVKLQVFLALNKLVAGDFEQNLVTQAAGAIVNAADDFAEIYVGKCVTELRHQNRQRPCMPPGKRAGHAVRLIPETLDGFG